MWMIPSQFGDSLEQFAKALAKKDDDGVFRYESSEVDQRSLDVAEEDHHEDWFKASSNPEIEAAVAAAKAVANKPVDEPTSVMSSSAKEKASGQPAIEQKIPSQSDDLLLDNPETLA